MAAEDQLSNSNGFDSPDLSDDDEMVMDISGSTDHAIASGNLTQSTSQHGASEKGAPLTELAAARLALGLEPEGDDKILRWSQLSEEELNRYEMFRRSTFPKASIKRLMQSISGTTVSQNVVIAMSGITKVFVGELVEEAIRIQKRYGESGPIEPKHIREAHRVIKNRSSKAVRIQ